MPSLEPKCYVDATGKCLGIFVDFEQPATFFLDRDGDVILVEGSPIVQTDSKLFSDVPKGAIEVPEAPQDGRDTWDGAKWIAFVTPPPPPTIETVVGALINKGLLSEADLAVATVRDTL